MARERWGSRLGVIMAVAGSAIGLGNFLRFPVQAAQNGGGAFMIPYFVALLLLGLPLMWIEWTVGRFGGGFGHSTAPGMFHTLWNKNRFIKYFGAIGIFGPIVIYIFYVYIESWLLGYSWFALTGRYASCTNQQTMTTFLKGYQGAPDNPYFSGLGLAYFFFLVTFAVNTLILYLGVQRGIEAVCKYGLPVLFILGVVLLVRVFTLGAPVRPDWNLDNALGYLWNPDWSALVTPVTLGWGDRELRLWVPNGKVWLAAAGQIFFTLSVGIGVILTYASYLTKKDDVALSGLTAAATNEVAEVILGGSIVIPAAFLFFGPQGTADAAHGGAFNLGFVTMPLVLQQCARPELFGFVWFILLFIAGVTSSISLAQPAVAFLEDEFGLSKRGAVLLFAAGTFLLCQPAIFFLGQGVLDELDFWGGTFCLVVFATIETILFAWVFGIEEAWTELHVGADITIPRFYRFIIKYVTPLVLIVILVTYAWQTWAGRLGAAGAIALETWDGVVAGVDPPIPLAHEGLVRFVETLFPATTNPAVFGTQVMLVGLFVILVLLVKIVWRRRAREAVP